jgi:hypothetical protein
MLVNYTTDPSFDISVSRAIETSLHSLRLLRLQPWTKPRRHPDHLGHEVSPGRLRRLSLSDSERSKLLAGAGLEVVYPDGAAGSLSGAAIPWVLPDADGDYGLTAELEDADGNVAAP